MPSREDMAERQAELVAHLLGRRGAPSGFDAAKLAVARDSLAKKHARMKEGTCEGHQAEPVGKRSFWDWLRASTRR